MSNLPLEIIISILEYLPLKSLFRFKCVSKTWNSLISNPTPEFTIRNFNNSIIHHNTNPIAIFNNNSSLEAKEFNPFKFHKAISRFDFRTPSEYWCNAQIVGCCNGIVAVFRRYKIINDQDSCFDLVLWNPFVKTYSRIPLAAFPCQVKSESVFGFGCINDNDYKIVRVTDSGNKKREVRVYSSNRNSWGLPIVVENVKDRFRMHEHGHGVLINNNVVHWLFRAPSGSDYEYVYSLRGFDLGLEKWIDLPLPNLLDVKDMDDLHALDGCLCLMVTQLYYGFNVWVMKKYGIQYSWAPLFGIPNTSICRHLLTPPIAFSKDGHGHEFLVRQGIWPFRNPCEFRWFNLRDNIIRRYFMPWDVIVCSGSLIRVPNGVLDK